MCTKIHLLKAIIFTEHIVKHPLTSEQLVETLKDLDIHVTDSFPMTLFHTFWHHQVDTV